MLYPSQFWTGISISIFTNLVQSFALAFQRKSHLNQKSRLWMTSFCIYLSANLIGSVFTIGYLPIVILAPIGALSLVFNAIAAYCVLGDPFDGRKIGGTIMIVFGTLLLGLFGVVTEPEHDINDLLRLYKKPAFIAYFSTLECIVVAGALVTHYCEHLVYQIESGTIPPSRKWMGRLSLEEFKKYIGISFGVLAGNVSSQSMLFAKSGMELILLTFFSNENQLNHVLTYILLVMMVLTAVLQLFYLNKGLKMCNTVIMIPISSCVFNVSCLFNGLVYYDQWDRFAWYQLLLTMVGVSITIGGVLFISWRVSSVNLVEEVIDDEIIAEVTKPNETTRLLDNRNHYN
ncbi:hypothetical protein BY458DRAFT_529235 [Sporodiniella umbellata]|nr:hypothetical protein BY458DRAFT_529235 [Sporodiniella umbellata]